MQCIDACSILMEAHAGRSIWDVLRFLSENKDGDDQCGPSEETKPQIDNADLRVRASQQYLCAHNKLHDHDVLSLCATHDQGGRCLCSCACYKHWMSIEYANFVSSGLGLGLHVRYQDMPEDRL